jgi:DNA-binding transcriptional regulator YdaS (Cro superfamily)
VGVAGIILQMGVVVTRGIDRAVEAAGTQAKLAEILGVTQQAVAGMVRRGHVSPARAIEIEALYGIPRRDLVSRRLADLLSTPFQE